MPSQLPLSFMIKIANPLCFDFLIFSMIGYAYFLSSFLSRSILKKMHVHLLPRSYSKYKVFLYTSS